MLNKIKLIAKLLPLLILFFVFTGSAFAATSIRLQQPTTQTGQNDFYLTFVALNTDNSAISVQCQKKGPGDVDFVNFDSPITLSAGGNTDKCHVNSSQVNQSGYTYSFRALANGTPSNVVGINYNSDAPGAPESYSKSKPDNCTYRISFHTASDNGKTVEVVLYRSTDQSFTLGDGTKVSSMNIGSNTDGHFDNNITPNCDTNYYYAIRAFSTYGVASGAVGDSGNQTVTTNATLTPTQQGPIPVGQQVLGTETGTKKEVLGEATKSAKPTVTPSSSVLAGKNPISISANWVLGHKKISAGILILILIGGYLFYRWYKKSKIS